MSTVAFREQIDPMTLEIDRDVRSGQLGPNQVAYLAIERGPGGLDQIEISSVSKVIGRGRDADVVIRDHSVSRAHAKVGRHPDGFVYIEDLGAKNGVFVNRQRCDVGILRSGDVVELGSVVLSLRVVDAPTNAANVVVLPRLELVTEHFPELSPRQREVALLACDGHTNSEIADALSISIRTVSTHLENIYSRLGVSSRLELAKRLNSRELSAT